MLDGLWDWLGLSPSQFMSILFAYVVVVVVTEYTMYQTKRKDIAEILDIRFSQGMSKEWLAYEKERLEKLDAIDVAMLAEKLRRDWYA